MADKLPCQECGCLCESCVTSNRTWTKLEELKLDTDILHLHQEIEALKRRLLEREYHILQMETSVIKHAQQFPNGEWEALRQELYMWKEKYERLYDSHKKLQKVNQGLEDKLLKLVDKFETEKASLTRDIADLTTRLVEARLSINDLEEQNELYKNDCNIAIQLLQCKPSNFVSQKLSSFPSDLQDKVKLHFTHHPENDNQSNGSPEIRTIRVPIPTFPPTAMVYSINSVSVTSESPSYTESSTPDYVSAAIMAKVLEERTKERIKRQEHCRICLYRRHSLDYTDKATQTRQPSLSMSGFCNNSQVVHVHSRHRSESSSSSDSHSYRSKNGSSTSTETAI